MKSLKLLRKMDAETQYTRKVFVWITIFRLWNTFSLCWWFDLHCRGRTRDSNQTSIRNTLDELKLFLDDNELVINQSKTSLMECMIKQKKGRTPGPPPSLRVEKEPGVEQIIEDSSYTRILGENIQGNMLWQSHLETGEKALFPQVPRLSYSLE